MSFLYVPRQFFSLLQKATKDLVRLATLPLQKTTTTNNKKKEFDEISLNFTMKGIFSEIV
jgi:hypothetical protein